MSDESDYYDSNSESEQSVQNEVTTKNAGNPIEYNHAKQFGNYEEDESEIGDDSEPDDAENEEEEEEDDDVQVGGVEDDPEDYYPNNSDEEPAEDEAKEPDDNTEVDDEEDDDIEIDEDGEPIEKVQKQSKTSKPKKTSQLIIEDEDDEEDEYDENYLQKFDSELNKNYIKEFHAECLNHNYDEVLKLAKVIRDDSNNIIDDLHRTIPYLTKYEKARILGQRAKQIETGAKPLVKVPENIVDGYVIAELELREKKIPFIIKRPIPGGAFEYWHLKDLEIIGF
jgi:DNA-directed RNA polymerase I, II, and III subunit RPABC2